MTYEGSEVGEGRVWRTIGRNGDVGREWEGVGSKREGWPQATSEERGKGFSRLAL